MISIIIFGNHHLIFLLFYIIHRVIQPHDSDEEELHVATDSPAKASKSSSVKKVISKSAHAKKLLNKKIRINQHIKFDEDGEPADQDSTGDKVKYPNEEENSNNSSSSESDDEQSLQPISIDEFERSTKRVKIGGIKIKKAKELLRSRDKMDRKRERERIRSAHRERRLKSRQAMKDGEEGVVSEGVRLVGASSSEDETEEQLLSELEEGEQSPSQSRLSPTEVDNELLSSDEEEMQQKRLKLDKCMKSKKRSVRKHKQLGTEPELASLMEDEELALHLLIS